MKIISKVILFWLLVIGGVAYAQDTSSASTPSSFFLLSGLPIEGVFSGHADADLFFRSDKGLVKISATDVKSESLVRLGVLSKNDPQSLWKRIEQLESVIAAMQQGHVVANSGSVISTKTLSQVYQDSTASDVTPVSPPPAPQTNSVATTPSTSAVATDTDTSHAGMTYVHGYYRKNGTYVHGYWRNQ